MGITLSASRYESMSSLYSLRSTLWGIRNRLTSRPDFLHRTGSSVDEPGHFAELRELDKLKDQLGLVLRELNNRANLLEVRKRNLWNISPQDRFRARSSIRSQTDDLNDVLALANDVKSMLDDMFLDSGLISKEDAAKGLGEWIQHIYHQAHEAGELLDSHHHSTYTSLQPDHFAGSVEGVTLAIYVSLQVVSYLAKRVSESRKKR